MRCSWAYAGLTRESGRSVGQCVEVKRRLTGTGEFIEGQCKRQSSFRILTWTTGKMVGGARDWLDFKCDVFCHKCTAQGVTSK